MRILISGASGLIGSAAAARLQCGGHEVVRLVRAPTSTPSTDLFWDPAAQRLDPHGFEGFDALIHLAGENVAARRWTAPQMARIRDSRVHATRLLSETLAGLSQPPKVFVSASAVGYYGSRGDEPGDENAAPGGGFLADVCRDWEAAGQAAKANGVRTVQLRLGLVLAADGGALARMLPIFRCGLGGRLGDGRQYVSWITLDDVTGAIEHILEHESIEGSVNIEGPVNLVAPQPVTNRHFTQALAKVLRRPAVLPVPSFVLRAALGRMADELLLAGVRAVPQRLLDSGYHFRDPDLDAALRRLLVGG